VTPTHGSTEQEARLRASDVDRLATVRVLQDAVARGLLTPDEGSERMATAFAAVHLAELGPLTADLPAGLAHPAAPGWRPLATMAVEQVRASLHRSPTGSRITRARVAVALLVVLVLLLLVGEMVGELFFDGRGDGGPGRFGDDFGDD
jgi:hypothetical protein